MRDVGQDTPRAKAKKKFYSTSSALALLFFSLLLLFHCWVRVGFYTANGLLWWTSGTICLVHADGIYYVGKRCSYEQDTGNLDVAMNFLYE